MSTLTFNAAAPANDWTAVVSGATYSRFAIQGASTAAVAVCIAQAKPSLASDDYMILRLGADKSIVEDLSALDVVYVRGFQFDSKVRGYKVER